MMYSADKHYSHLDPSEPIPEIEPRYDEHQLRMTRELVRRMPYVLGTLVLLVVVFYIWEPTFWARIGIVGVTYISGLAYLIRYGRRNSTKSSRRDARNQLDTWGIPMSLMIRQQVYWIGIIILFMHLLGTNSGSMQAVFMLGFYAFGAGLVLAIANRNFRQPGQISCERCFYPLVGLTLPTSCPECGRAILNLSFATDRPKLRDNRFLIAGILLTVFGAITIYVQFVKPTWLYAPIPRSMLIPLAAHDPDAFDRLVGGSLTAVEEQQLIEAMVNNRTGFVYGSSFAQDRWFAAKIGMGALTAHQLDTLCEQFTQCEILAPERARVGQTLRLQLVVDDHESAPSGYSPMYYFEGFRINDDPTPYAQSSHAMYRNFLDSPEEDMLSRMGSVPVYEWTPQQPGTFTIHARLVLVISTTADSKIEIDWSQPDDQRFPRPHVWSRDLVLKHTIEIE
ncbi:MAG: hypothetical protein R3B67_10555 [Phycisphaerales bacterium]